MLKLSTRLLAALPDALTAVTYFCAWVAPALLGVVWVRNLQTTILIELLVLHASALYGFGVAKNRQWKRWMLLSALSVVYLLVMLALARKFQSPWPIFAFFWLFTCRFGYILLHPATAERDSERAQWVWLWSVVAFAIGSWLGDHLSLPKLGMTEHYARRLRLPGDAENGVAPHLTMAFGTTYFLLQAFLKVHFERCAGRAAVTPSEP